MRSRYCAYVLQDNAYLQATWHASTRPTVIDFDPNLRWIGLQIRDIRAGGESDSAGTVEFVARYKIKGRAYRLHELSNFVKQAARWFYMDGKAL